MPAILSNIVDVYPFRAAGGDCEFLLLRRRSADPLGDTWQSVHGKIEAGETAWQAALRELQEETGLRPLRFWQIDFVNTFYVARRDEIQFCACFAAEIARDAQVVLSDEHTEYRWVAAARALGVDGSGQSPAYMWPGQKQAVREVLDYIVRPSPAEPHLRIPTDASDGATPAPYDRRA